MTLTRPGSCSEPNANDWRTYGCTAVQEWPSPCQAPELRSGRIEFPATAAAARSARQWVAGLLASTCPADLVDTAVLLVSELVTNAVRASAAAAVACACPDARRIGLAIAHSRDTLRIEVADSARGAVPARPGDPGDDAESGRGLQVVAALAARWGCRPAAPGKAVWCEIPAAGLAPALATPGDPALAIRVDPAARPRRAWHPSPVAVGADITSRNET
jgi:anti-sigma regulatory factor (Ser/Thr protein kinase)